MGALIGGGIATVLTLCVLSRAIADNALYRLALSLLIGSAFGYVAAALLRGALIPAVETLLVTPPTSERWIVTLSGLALGVLLLPRFGRQRTSSLANFPLALLFGVGAALILIGVVRGTLAPQLIQTMRLGNVGALGSSSLEAQIGAAVTALLTVTTLLAFRYTQRRPAEPGERRRPSLLGALRGLSRLLILIAFGVFFAATVTTYLAALVGQLDAISGWVEALWAQLP